MERRPGVVPEASMEAQPLQSQLSPVDTKAELAGPEPEPGSPGTTGLFNIYALLRQLQLIWGGQLVRMDAELFLKRLFYGAVATGSHRQ
ncbi:unnamed protein product [Schistocephalus solidus]|uniref:Neurobeachin-like protein 2 n=1 Tax=Schistocephalus solidus TaxID=70667 RepID=A0A183SX96_SCHSO|nr:unnamed protein product [Schistocephalus solidus]